MNGIELHLQIEIGGWEQNQSFIIQATQVSQATTKAIGEKWFKTTIVTLLGINVSNYWVTLSIYDWHSRTSLEPLLPIFNISWNRSYHVSIHLLISISSAPFYTTTLLMLVEVEIRETYWPLTIIFHLNDPLYYSFILLVSSLRKSC